MKNHLVLIRHGESTANVDESFYKLPDCCVALTPTGILQSVECGKAISEMKHINLWHDGLSVFSSKLTRAKQTAEIVLRSAHLRHVNPIETPSLNERDGRYETYVQTRDRVGLWWNQHEYLLSAGNVIIFAHAFVLSAFMSHLLNLSNEEMEQMRVKNAIPHVFVKEDGYIKL